MRSLTSLGNIRRFSFSARHAFSQPIEAKRRRDLLARVYAPFRQLKEGSDEWHKLARSGRVWEDYFGPYDNATYLDAQRENQEMLTFIDRMNSWVGSHLDRRRLTLTLVPEYAHESVAIEGNSLSAGDAVIISEKMDKSIFQELEDPATISIEALSTISLPEAADLLPGKDSSQVSELRNHILVSRYIVEKSLKCPKTVGLAWDEIRKLQAILVKGTQTEDVYANSWGPRIKPGEIRNVPIGVRSNKQRIFPYPDELAAILERFFLWREKAYNSKTLHPLILGIQIMIYFLHIHPFNDGNGRVSRVLLADYLIRNGYVPFIMGDLDREDYPRMISDAQDGNALEICTRMVLSQHDALFNLNSLGQE